MKRNPTTKELDAMVEQISEDQEFDCNGSVMDCIKSGRSKMRARWLVLTEELGIKTSWVLAVLFLIAIVNLDLFILSHGPGWEFLEFGASGFEVVLKNIPFGWFAMGLLLLVIAVYLMKSFRWSYAYPFKVFVLLLVLGVFTVGGITFATGINDTLYMKLVEEPGAGNTFIAKVYCMLANRNLASSHALRGEVMYVSSNSMVIQTPTLEVVTVKMADDAKILYEGDLERFDYIKLLGKHDGAVFVASMIKRHEDPDEIMPISRDEQDCIDKHEWQHTKEVVEKRRHAALEPVSPVQGMAELIRSIE